MKVKAAPLMPDSKMPLLVAVDTLSIQPTSGGIRVYLSELVRHVNQGDIHFVLLCSSSNVAAFADLPADKICLPWPTRSRWVRILSQQLVLPVLLLKVRPKVLLSPVDIAPLAAPVPVVTCVHSSHLNAKAGYSGWLQSLYNRLFVTATLARSRALVAISSYVARETARMYPPAAKKITVVYHGAGLVERARAAGWRPALDEARDGILFVGTLHPHKRVDALIRAYARLRARHPDRTQAGLMIVGHDPVGMGASLRQLTASLGLSDCVHLLGRLDDPALLNLYGRSRLLVLPSEVEGFGIPVIEALQARLPVVVANRCALPEIAGDAGLCVEPDDFDALADAMASACWNSMTRQRLIAEGARRGPLFSWADCAARTTQILRTVARHHSDRVQKA